MAKDYSICVGTVGMGVWYSPDGGDNWSIQGRPFPLECKARALTVYPNNPRRILAGTDVGLHRSEDSGASWTKLDSPMDGLEIFSIAIDREDPDVIFAGARAAAVFRSKDGGIRWEKLPANFPEDCYIGQTRILGLTIDPRDRRNVWAGAEIGGVARSRDGGDTWTTVPPLGGDSNDSDIHCITISVGEPTRVLVACPNGVWSSTDEGETWQLSDFRPAYCRGMALKADDSRVVFVGNGPLVLSPEISGNIRRSRDNGYTWEDLPLPVDPNSHIDWFATNPTDPNLILASTLLGEVFSSSDGGDSWEKLRREFTQIRSIAWMPN